MFNMKKEEKTPTNVFANRIEPKAEMPEDKHNWVGAIHTNSGGTFDIVNPTADMISIFDIAQGLSLQCRYNGQIPSFYSVAEHSVRVSDWLVELGYSDLAFAGLMHDASEAYIGDIVRPMKQLPEFGGLYKKFEKTIEEVIGERFDVEIYPMHPDVAQADKAIYEWEVENIRSGKRNGLSWQDSRDAFIDRYNRYCKTRDITDQYQTGDVLRPNQIRRIFGLEVLDPINIKPGENGYFGYEPFVFEQETISEGGVGCHKPFEPKEDTYLIIDCDPVEKLLELMNRRAEVVSYAQADVECTQDLYDQYNWIIPQEEIEEEPMFDVPVLIESSYETHTEYEDGQIVSVTTTETNRFKED